MREHQPDEAEVTSEHKCRGYRVELLHKTMHDKTVTLAKTELSTSKAQSPCNRGNGDKTGRGRSCRRRRLVLRLLERHRLGQLGRRDAEVDEPAERRRWEQGVRTSSLRVRGRAARARRGTHLEKAFEKSPKNACSSLAYCCEYLRNSLSVVRAMSVRSIMRLLSDLFSNLRASEVPRQLGRAHDR